ncbi:SDR family oxidoreductase [Microbacteriaceae bacterium 4G12]
MMQQMLHGKTAIVTGAGSGMGKAIAQLFVEQGANVIFADINFETAKTAAALCSRAQAKVMQMNVTNDEEVAAVVKETVDTFDKLDIVVNCAGVPQAFTPIEELSSKQWNYIIDVNLKSIFLMAKHAVPIMKQKESGSIVSVASIAGIRARPGLNAYCASKGAAIMLTKSLALELAPYKIRVNAINPGPAETPMLEQFLGEKNSALEKEKIFLDSIPLRTLIQPEDIAQAALYLASDLSKIVTGEILNVDGGRGI